jgi:ABC-2 type transport system permease protein
VTSLRVVWGGFRFHVKTLTLSNFFLLTTFLLPAIFASIAFFLVEAGGRPGTLLYTALGAGMMGVWSSTLFGSGGAIQWQRYQGTLELLVATPSPFLLVLLPITLASATVGAYSLGMTLVFGRVVFGVPLDLAHPVALVVAIPAMVIGLGFLGLLLATTFVLYRYANALSNLLEYPVWLVTGLLVPVSLLPVWVEPISWVLAPTWGVRAIRESALGGHPWSSIGMCLVLAALYFVLASFFLRVFERLARGRATLSLS